MLNSNDGGVVYATIEQVQQMLEKKGPYPMIALPPTGGYWVDGVWPATNMEDLNSGEFGWNDDERTLALEVDSTAQAYRRFFLDKEHCNYYGNDKTYGKIVLSIRYENRHSEDGLVRILLRNSTSSSYDVILLSSLPSSTSPIQIAQLIRSKSTVEYLRPALEPYTSQLILSFDEHVLTSTFKFGIIYQKFGQINEEEMFANNDTTPEFEEFLNFIGQKIELKDFKGFRGGLDTRSDQTGCHSIFTTYQGNQIMFHVSTLLPYSETDVQQLQRKRHIGNDIVALIFQEVNTVFIPNMIASNFLHSFIVVQPLPKTSPDVDTHYVVSITAREDVPFFGAPLPKKMIFKKDVFFRNFLFTKLINAEHASYKAQRFQKLEERTRCALFENLYEELALRNTEFFNNMTSQLPSSSNISGSSSSSLSSIQQPIIINPALINESKHESNKILETFKRVIVGGKVRSQSAELSINNSEKGKKFGNVPSPLPSLGEYDFIPPAVSPLKTPGESPFTDIKHHRISPKSKCDFGHNFFAHSSRHAASLVTNLTIKICENCDDNTESSTNLDQFSYTSEPISPQITSPLTSECAQASLTVSTTPHTLNPVAQSSSESSPEATMVKKVPKIGAVDQTSCSSLLVEDSSDTGVESMSSGEGRRSHSGLADIRRTSSNSFSDDQEFNFLPNLEGESEQMLTMKNEIDKLRSKKKKVPTATLR